MDIQKLGRTALKAYFVKNAVPTESNFADLIDGMLNEKDDGIVKPPGDALSIQAAGDGTSLQKAINFYKNFTDKDPAWTLSLNPRADPNKPDTAKPGWSIGDAAGNSSLFVAQSDGRVGIGTINPAENVTLDVNGRIKSGPLLLGRWPANSTTDYGFVGASTLDQTKTGNYALLQATSKAEGPGRTYLNSPEDIRFRIGNADHMILAKNGHVGIGTGWLTPPAQRLHVGGNAQIGNVFVGDVGYGSDWAGFSHANSVSQEGYGFLQDIKGQQTLINKKSGGGHIGFRIDNKDKIVIDDAGKLGIGITTPAEALDVNGNIRMAANMKLTSPGRMHIAGEEFLYLVNKKGVIVGKEGGGTGILSVQGLLVALTGLQTPFVELGSKWRLSGVGDEQGGVKRNDDWLRLTNVVGTAFRGGLAAQQLWSEDGTVVKSDARLKQDVCPLQHCLDDVLALRAVRFRWRDAAPGDPQAMGLIAQEVETVFPEVVTDGPDGFKGINYTGLIGPLIEAIKEQQARIDELGAEIRLLKAS